LIVAEKNATGMARGSNVNTLRGAISMTRQQINPQSGIEMGFRRKALSGA
jgi:hypothetical protein